MRRIALIAAIALPMGAPCGYAASAGSTGAAFLELPVGARPEAMGSAYSAVSQDAYAPLWNPAGLAGVRHPELAATHLIHIEETASEFVGFAMPLPHQQGVGATVQYFRPGTIDGRDENDQSIGDIKGYGAAMTLAYAVKLGSILSLGVSGKVLQYKIDDVTASAYAAGAGAQVELRTNLMLGLAVDNLGTPVQFLEAEDPLPATGRLGVAYRPIKRLLIAAEGALHRGGILSGHGGIELRSEKDFSLRTGFNSERIQGLSPMAGWTLGAGLKVWGQEIAYTWMPLSQLGNSHLISVQFSFGKPRPQEASQSLRDAEWRNTDYEHINEILR